LHFISPTHDFGVRVAISGCDTTGHLADCAKAAILIACPKLEGDESFVFPELGYAGFGSY
jgi:hypothetical protein